MYILNNVLLVFNFLCIFYNYYLDKLDSNLKLLDSLCTSNSYIKNYIIRNKNVYHIQTDQDNLDNLNKNELEVKNFFIDIENSKSIDWIIFIEILKLNWCKFNIFGVDIENWSYQSLDETNRVAEIIKEKINN